MVIVSMWRRLGGRRLKPVVEARGEGEEGWVKVKV